MKIISQEELEKSKGNLDAQIDKLYSSTNKESDDERKRTNNYLQWISTKTQYVMDEPSFVCDKEDKLKRGAVVWIEFGFNVGDEFGGRHPAVILRKTPTSVFVVPLSSQEPSVKKDYHVKVEKVYGFKNMVRWTNVLTLQNVSIQRIDTNASIGNVKGKVLNDINEALKKCHIF
ncbi:MAG: type II toxin-antitoxin system PemK/MazF family toxin [Lachnospiraceae bacterium]|nr:type II toxin-antitoxin system PemK/MazF family toxin [Lachnospiraceae bacterium]